MTTFRFVHTADLHLDSPFRGLRRRASPGAAKALHDATFEAFDRIADLCLREKVDALLIAGDIHDAADRSARSVVRFHKRVCELASSGVSSFIVRGNHDPLSSGDAIDWPSGVHVFSSTVEDVPLRVRGEEVARVVGVSYPERDVTENLARRFRRPAGAPYAIALLHANVGCHDAHANYAPCSIDDLVAAGFDYWALGHVHAPSVLRDRDPVVVYPGTPQGLARSDIGPRGCTLVTVANGATSLEFVEIGGIRWERLAVAAGGVELASAIDAVRKGIAAAIERAARSLVLRIEVRDVERPLHGGWTDAALAPVIEDLERDFSTQDRFLLIEELTVTPLRAPARATSDEEPSLAGELRRLVAEIQAGATRAGYHEALRPLTTELAARRAGEPPSDVELEALLGRAATLAESLLVDEGA